MLTTSFTLMVSPENIKNKNACFLWVSCCFFTLTARLMLSSKHYPGFQRKQLKLKLDFDEYLGTSQN